MLADVGYLPLVTHCHSVEPYLFGPSCCVLAFFCGPSPTEADLAPNLVWTTRCRVITLPS